jgi:hypothetical protein
MQQVNRTEEPLLQTDSSKTTTCDSCVQYWMCCMDLFCYTFMVVGACISCRN